MLPVIFPAIFLLLMELLVFLPESYFWLLTLSAFVLSLYAVWRVPLETSLERFSFLILTIPLVLVGIFLLGISQSIIFSQAIILSASLIFYALAAGYPARNTSIAALVSFVEFLVIVFLILAYQMTSAASGWVIGPIVFVSAFSLFFASISLTVNTAGTLIIRLLYFSLLAGFAVTEFYFALARLPFNLPSIDFLVFIIYYGLWDVSLRYFSQRLTKKILLFDVLLILFSFAVVFSSAKWFPN